ncbi:MAG: hypothetical protein C0459_09590 [Chitinophaga sp.]|jgi:hypothetical protein|nr:hypothetical protein [Chitinophaga sp.]
MKKIAYTVCSANHLAYAKTMADSFSKHNNDYHVFICLVDKINGRFDSNFFKPYLLIEAENIGIDSFEKMSNQYTIIELNCAVKPFMAQYLIKEYNPEILIYVDTDIYFYQSLNTIEKQLETSSIILTPHYTTPINDKRLSTERDVIRSGLYNAGFIAMKVTDITKDFLQWWSNHLIDECYYNFAEGMGVDQTWLNLVPLFFDEVIVSNNKGLNVAYWNLHERSLSIKHNSVVVNENEPLIFLHISGYKFEMPEILSKHQNRFDLSNLPVLRNLLEDYTKEVKANGYDMFINLNCFYSKPVKKSTGLMRTINKLLKPLGVKISNL